MIQFSVQMIIGIGDNQRYSSNLETIVTENVLVTFVTTDKKA